MKTVSITELPKGTTFNYKGMQWIVTEDEYPIVTAKCLTEPNEYEGLEVGFWNFEEVEVENETICYKYKFKENGKNSYQLVRETEDELPF